MQKIEQDIYIIITELGAEATVVIPPIDLNDIRRERNEYLAQTASDLYDRVVYMVRSEQLEYDPVLEEEEGPLLEIEVRMGMFSVSSSFWRETRRENDGRGRPLLPPLHSARAGRRCRRQRRRGRPSACRTRLARGALAVPAHHSSTRACASSGRAAGCRVGCGSSARRAL